MARRWLSMVVSAFGLAAALFGPAAGAGARADDPHALYERNCAGCHATHAREFVMKSLALRDAVIVGRQGGEAIGALLARGHGRLAADEVPLMVAHLGAILRAGGLFFRRCAQCHGRGVAFARRDLLERGGRVVGRYSGRDIEVFLGNHGRLNGAEIAVIMEMLQRQLRARR